MNRQQPATVPTNDATEVERLTNLVAALQAECERLSTELAVAEGERQVYRMAYSDSIRAEMMREFGDDIDIPTLERISTGPVDTI
jgi:hypothetical protein